MFCATLLLFPPLFPLNRAIRDHIWVLQGHKPAGRHVGTAAGGQGALTAGPGSVSEQGRAAAGSQREQGRHRWGNIDGFTLRPVKNSPVFFFLNLYYSYTDAELEPDEFMNSKKSHEVQSMSEVVACLAERCRVKQVERSCSEHLHDLVSDSMCDFTLISPR